MDLRHLRGFVEIVEQKSFTGAAQKLYVSQPVLSAQLKDLEKELGCQLLVRTSRQMSLTRAGEALYRQAKQMLALEKNVRKELEDITKLQGGTLRLGLLPSLSTSLLGGTLADFSQRYPSVSFQITEGSTDDLLHDLESGVLDVAFVRAPCCIGSQLDAYAFHCEKMIVAYQKEFFSFSEDAVTIPMLRDLPILISGRFQELFTQACLQEYFTPYIKCASHDMSTSLAWAAKGLGIALIPYTTYTGHPYESMSYRPLLSPYFNISLLMVKRKQGYLSRQAQLFYTFCQEYLDQNYQAFAKQTTYCPSPAYQSL